MHLARMWISHLGYRSAAEGDYQQYRDEAGDDSCGVVYDGIAGVGARTAGQRAAA